MANVQGMDISFVALIVCTHRQSDWLLWIQNAGLDGPGSKSKMYVFMNQMKTGEAESS